MRKQFDGLARRFAAFIDVYFQPSHTQAAGVIIAAIGVPIGPLLVSLTTTMPRPVLVQFIVDNLTKAIVLYLLYLGFVFGIAVLYFRGRKLGADDFLKRNKREEEERLRLKKITNEEQRQQAAKEKAMEKQMKKNEEMFAERERRKKPFKSGLW